MNQKSLYTLLMLLACCLSSQAQEKPGNLYVRDQPYFAVGINPTYPFLGGYGIKAFYNLPERWSFVLSSEGAFELPDFATEQFFTNGENIIVNWDYAVGVEARYRFNQKDNDIKGLFAFATFGFEEWTVSAAADAGGAGTNQEEDEFDNWFSSLGVGYNWFPFKKSGFWVGAAYNVIFILNNTDDRTVDNTTYRIRSVVPPSFAPNIYVGWRF